MPDNSDLALIYVKVIARYHPDRSDRDCDASWPIMATEITKLLTVRYNALKVLGLS